MKINVRELSSEILIQFYFILRNEGFHQYADGITKEIRRRGENVHEIMNKTETYTIIKEKDANNDD